MRKLYRIALLSACAAAAATAHHAHGQENPARLAVEVAGIAPLTGQLRIAAFCSEDAYRSFSADAARIVSVSGGSARTHLSLRPGRCAVLVHHDRDGDGLLTRGFLGIPSEPTAASNGARGFLGPPSWRRVAVPISAGENRIQVRFR